jgi:hypothetical protein
MNNLTNAEIIFQITRLTERAIALIDSGHINESLDMIENRDRAVNILMSAQNIEDTLAPQLKRLDELNEVLLNKLVTVKEQNQIEIADTHKKSQVHKAYQSTQVK